MVEPGGKLNFPGALTQVKEENDFELQKDDLDEDINIEDEIKNSAKFENLIDLIGTSFSESQSSVQELLQLKDELLKSFLPPPLLFRIAVVFGNLYRSFSDLNTPVYEMLRLVKIFSASWEKNSQMLKRISDMHENKKQLLNIAIKRLAGVDKKTKLFAKEKRIQNWEKLFIKLNESKGHGRRWKFRMETFRNKANGGYSELLKWVLTDQSGDHKEEPEPIMTKRKSVRRGRRRSKEIVREQRKKKEIESDLDIDEDKLSLDTTSQFDEFDDRRNNSNYIEVDSDQDIFSDLSSEGGASRKKGKDKENLVQKPVVETKDTEAQTQPNLEDKITWTGEPNYTRYFIVRTFKPLEFDAKDLKFIITMGDETYTSKSFKKIEKKVKIVENDKPKKPKRLSIIQKQSTEEPSEPKIDQNKFEDFLFEVDDNFSKKGKSMLSTTMNNSIKFELNFEDPDFLPCFSSINMDDIHTLDLPILYYKSTEEVQEANFYDKNGAVKQLDRENSTSWLRLNEFTDDSNSDYGILSKRTPFLFDMYNTRVTNKIKGGDTVCKLPLMFFWIRKPSVLKLDKCTGSETLKDIVEDYTGFDIEEITRDEIQKKFNEKPEVLDVHEVACSPMPIEEEPPKPPVIESERTVSSPTVALTPKQYDVIEVNQSVPNDEIITMQETYQLKIDELNLAIYKLENENANLKSINEMKTLEANRKEKYKQSKNANPPPPKEKLQKIAKSPDPSSYSSYEKPAPTIKVTTNLPKNINTNQSIPTNPNHNMIRKPPLSQNEFFERLNFYSEEHTKHHKELYNKYMEEEANMREQQMIVQHRLDTGQRANNKYEDFCLPAVFMPFKSGNSVYNPRAHKYFHPSGSNDIRLTQPPTIFQLPALPAKSSISVINLFDLGRRYQQGEPDYYINEYINRQYDAAKQPEQQTQSTNPPVTSGSRNNSRMKTDDENYQTHNPNANKPNSNPFGIESERSQLNINLSNLNLNN